MVHLLYEDRKNIEYFKYYSIKNLNESIISHKVKVQSTELTLSTQGTPVPDGHNSLMHNHSPNLT